VTTLISGLVCALCAAVLPIGILSELTSIGTLFAFVLVSLGVMILRRTHPNLDRKFEVPGGPYVVPIMGAITSGGLVCTATVPTIYRLFAWMGLGWIIYAFYGYKRSTLRNLTLPSAAAPPSETSEESTHEGAANETKAMQS
jgi:basic amino acid/polyamine antiporter, APA family